MLEYSCTNEDLGGIVLGLDLSSDDHVLAIGGSGDPAFAMLEFAGRVTAVDILPEQVRFMQERAETLGKGDIYSFFGKECDMPYITRYFHIKRKEYFSKSKTRLNKIRQNLDNLIISEPQSIFEIIRREHTFNKIYLSNILTFKNKSNFVTENLKYFGKALPKGGLIYVDEDPYQKYTCLNVESILPELRIPMKRVCEVRKSLKGKGLVLGSPMIYKRMA